MESLRSFAQINAGVATPGGRLEGLRRRRHFRRARQAGGEGAAEPSCTCLALSPTLCRENERRADREDQGRDEEGSGARSRAARPKNRATKEGSSRALPTHNVVAAREAFTLVG